MSRPRGVVTPMQTSSQRWNWFLAADFEGKWITVNGFAEVRLEDSSRFEGVLRLNPFSGIYHRMAATIDEEGKVDAVVASPETGTPPFELRGEFFERKPVTEQPTRCYC